MEALANKENAPEGGSKMEIIFIIFGIGSLLAWNAILSDISFFINYQGKYDPPTWFSFCNFFLSSSNCLKITPFSSSPTFKYFFIISFNSCNTFISITFFL